jgi:CubicO group peptidase (beta-lactamase class C family)
MPDASQRRVSCEIDTLRGALIGIPSVGGLSTAAGVAMLYQAFLSNPGGLWRDETVDEARYTRCVDGSDPKGRPVRRTFTFLQAGPRADRYGERMFFGPRVSDSTFGHQGQGGQVAWADPQAGLSFCVLTNPITFPPGGCYHPRAPERSTLVAQGLP